MNIGKYTLIVLVLIVVLGVAGLFAMEAAGLTIATAVVIEPEHGLVLLGSSPVTMAGVDFERYERGDRIFLIMRGAIASSYPGQARGYYGLRIGRDGEIPDKVMSSLAEMGWVK